MSTYQKRICPIGAIYFSYQYHLAECATLITKNDKKPRRSKQRGSKYPQRKVITTTDQAERERFYTLTDQEAPLGKYQLAAGTIQNPHNRLWQVRLSTNGLDLNHISAHREPEKATSDVEQIKAAAARGDLYDVDKVTALFVRLEAGGDGKPVPLPDDLVRAIGRDIFHHVIGVSLRKVSWAAK